MRGTLPPQCSWTGVTESGGRAEPCGLPAVGFVEDRFGRRTYACGEHIDSARARAGAGRFVRQVREEDDAPPLTHHGASRQARHNLSSFGETG